MEHQRKHKKCGKQNIKDKKQVRPLDSDALNEVDETKNKKQCWNVLIPLKNQNSGALDVFLY